MLSRPSGCTARAPRWRWHGRRRLPADHPFVRFPEAAAHALGRRRRPRRLAPAPGWPIPDFDDIDLAGAREIIEHALAEHPDGRWLGPAEAGALLRCFGIPVAGYKVAATVAEAVAAAGALGYPVALKAAAAELVHKSDVGGVTLGLADTNT